MHFGGIFKIQKRCWVISLQNRAIIPGYDIKLNYFFIIFFSLQSLPDDCGITTTENEDGDTFTLRIDKPTYKRRGKYTCKADGVETAGYLDFDGKNYLFI